MNEVVHGGYYGGLTDAIDFSVNLNPLGTPKELTDAIKTCFKEGVLQKYPDYRYTELTSSIIRFYNLQQGDVIPTNGASEGINAVLFAIRPKELLVIEPAYGNYVYLAKALGINLKHFLMSEETSRFILDIHDLIRSVKKLGKKSLILWTNPNNPTGASSSSDDILSLALEVQEKAYLLVDEAYVELSGMTGLLNVDEMPNNVVVIRSFTKTFSLPGLRIGFIYLRNKEEALKIKSILPSWNINSLAECSIKRALSYHEKELHTFIRRSVKEIARLRTEFTDLLKSIGLKVFNSVTNFLLIKHEGIPTELLHNELLKKCRIFIRPASTFYGLNSYYSRVSVRNTADNSLLVKCIERYLKGL